MTKNELLAVVSGVAMINRSTGTILIISKSFKSLFEQNYHRFDGSSFSNVRNGCFSLPYVSVNEMSTGFGLLDGQTSFSKMSSWDSSMLWWAFSTIFGHIIIASRSPTSFKSQPVLLCVHLSLWSLFVWCLFCVLWQRNRWVSQGCWAALSDISSTSRSDYSSQMINGADS